jgi:hypothetical protein
MTPSNAKKLYPVPGRESNPQKPGVYLSEKFCLRSGYVFTQAAPVLIESNPTAERPEQNESKTMKNTTPISDATQPIGHGDNCACIICFAEMKPGIPAEQERKRQQARLAQQDARRRAEEAMEDDSLAIECTVEELTEQFLDVAEDIAAEEKAATPNPLLEGCSPERQEALTVRELRALLFDVADQDRTVTFSGAWRNTITQVDAGRTFTNEVELS